MILLLPCEQLTVLWCLSDEDQAGRGEAAALLASGSAENSAAAGSERGKV